MDDTAARRRAGAPTTLAPVPAPGPSPLALRGTPAAGTRRPRRAPEFVLTWLPVPNDGTDPGTPLGTCLVLRSVGRRTPRRLVLDLPSGAHRVVERPRRQSPVGVATPVELPALVAVGTVFVEWEGRDGVARTTWLRVPPVPARYRTGSAAR